MTHITPPANILRSTIKSLSGLRDCGDFCDLVVKVILIVVVGELEVMVMVMVL